MRPSGISVMAQVGVVAAQGCQFGTVDFTSLNTVHLPLFPSQFAARRSLDLLL